MILGPATDETLKDFCKKEGLQAHFPLCAEDDLIKRYLNAAYELDCNYIVRITADCWESNAELIAEAAGLLNRVDYISNTIQRSFVEGLDLQACSRRALEWVDKHQTERREHPFIDLDRNEITRVAFEKSGLKWSELLNPQLSFLFKGTSIDTREDLERIRKWHGERTKQQLA
jgi:spore coat polysaccharide biosynthesis protein SpsF (cytidylyltransferase family)